MFHTFLQLQEIFANYNLTQLANFYQRFSDISLIKKIFKKLRKADTLIYKQLGQCLIFLVTNITKYGYFLGLQLDMLVKFYLVSLGIKSVCTELIKLKLS